MRAIGFCHLAASNSSTRVSFVLDEVVASRPRMFFGSAFAARPVFYAERAFEHPAVSRRRDDFGAFRATFHVRSDPNRCRACRASSMRRLADPSAAAHVIEAAPRAPHDRAREDSTALRSGTTSIERCISSTCALRRLPRATGMRPSLAILRGCVGFAANAPFTTPLRRYDSALRLQARLSRLGPRSRPLVWLDAVASLGQSWPFDFCNEFSKYETRARTPRALSSPAAGDCPAVVATHDALFTLPASSSFECKEEPSSMRRSELRVIPRRSASRAEPRSPRASPPRATPFKWARRTWETRRPKEPSKGERTRSRDRVRPSGACAPRSFLVALPSTFCHRRCVRDGMEARSRACTRPHRRPRHSFRLRSREGPRHSEHLGCFSPLESNDGRDRSLNHPTGPPRHATVFPALQRGVSAPLLPNVLAWS